MLDPIRYVCSGQNCTNTLSQTPQSLLEYSFDCFALLSALILWRLSNSCGLDRAWKTWLWFLNRKSLNSSKMIH